MVYSHKLNITDIECIRAHSGVISHANRDKGSIPISCIIREAYMQYNTTLMVELMHLELVMDNIYNQCLVHTFCAIKYSSLT